METNQELMSQLSELVDKVSGLEARIAHLEKQQQIPEEDLVAIGAAVAAYFGHKAKVRAIRYSTQSRWGAAARGRIHDRSVPQFR